MGRHRTRLGQDTKSVKRLEQENTVAKGGELLAVGEAICRVGDQPDSRPISHSGNAGYGPWPLVLFRTDGAGQVVR